MAATVRSLGILAIFLVLSDYAMTAVPPCPQITIQLAPCVSFITGKTPEPETACCTGVKGIAASTSTPADRQAVCECIKSKLTRIPKYKPALIAEVPEKCGVNIKIPPVDQNTTCTNVFQKDLMAN